MRRRRAAAGLVATVLVLAGCTGSPDPTPTPTAAAAPSVVPLPADLTAASGAPFALGAGVTVAADPAMAAPAQALADLVQDDTGIAVQTAATDGDISIVKDPDVTGIDGYRLEVGHDGITIAAAGPSGAFAAVQTLRQLVPLGDSGATRQVPPVRVVDAARFAYRGAMLDVARHFFDVEDVERYVDDISALKVNHLHLHLSDDQGWRIAVTSWPKLTEVGAANAVDGDPGGFYTQDDYRAIVAYAASRGVTVVPEIDLPGHTNAALTSYAELNPGGKAVPAYSGIDVGFSTLDPSSETTYRFVKDVLDEVAAMTPGPYLHMGGDESRATSDEDYATFVKRAAGIAADTGKTVIGWHEITDAGELPPGTVAQYWNYVRPETTSLAGRMRAYVERGGHLLMSPADVAYLDMKYDESSPHGLLWARGYTDLTEAYGWDPAAIIDGVDDDGILGVEAPIWTETLRTIEDVESMAFPRLAAIAEIAWTAQADRQYDDFVTRLPALGDRWAAAGVAYTPVPGVPWH
ncbi:MAG: family 20 glycosylhydrolase [Brevundimonas sp.]